MTQLFDLPRYKANPIYAYFEAYIVHVLGRMSKEKYAGIQSLDLQSTFKTSASEWTDVMKEVLQLSETIEIAIQDLWHRNRDGYDDDQYGYHAFAQDFTDQYMAEDSKVDVWPEGALEAAKDRISEAEQGGGGSTPISGRVKSDSPDAVESD